MPIAMITLASFVVVTTVVLAFGMALRRTAPVAQRVRQLVADAPAETQPRRHEEGSGPLGGMVAAIGTHFGGDRSLSQRLAYAGFRGPNAMAVFLGARTLISVGPALLVLLIGVPSGKPLGAALLNAAIAWGAGHLLANLVLKRRACQRVQQLTRRLPDALDLMVVWLEAGLGLNATINKVGEERSAMHDVLGAEFGQVSAELRDGRPRVDALRGLASRNGCADLKSLVALVIQSDRLGASMSKTLRTHADLLRTRRRQRAEETARKLPIKVLFPLALCILPALFIITTGPAVLKIGDLSSFMAKQ